MVIRSLYAEGDLSDGAIDAEFAFNRACKLVTVFLHADQDITEDVTISYDSVNGASYDTVIKARTLSSESDYVFAAQGDIALNEGDKIRVAVTNANLVGQVFISVKVEV